MKAHPDSMNVQRDACKMMCDIISRSNRGRRLYDFVVDDPVCPPSFVQHNTCSAQCVMSAMIKFQYDVDLNQYSCQLLSVCPNETLAHPGALEQVIKATKNFPEDVIILSSACLLLKRMKLQRDKYRQVVDAGALDCIKDIMITLPDLDHVQVAACMALTSLAKDQDTNIQIGHSGAIDLVISAVLWHRTRQVSATALVALSLIAEAEQNRAKIIASGGIELLVTCL